MSDAHDPFHAHIYYAVADRSVAERLHAELRAGKGRGDLLDVLFVGEMTDRAVGPHPLPQYEVHFHRKALPIVLERIKGHRLRALVHRLTDDDLADHTTQGALDRRTADARSLGDGPARHEPGHRPVRKVRLLSMKRPPSHLTLYGSAGSGSVAVEAALTLLRVPFVIIEGATWAQAPARRRVGTTNSMQQIPTLVLPDGEVMTESAAILIYLADLYADRALAPSPQDPRRRQFLRWMLFVSSAIYALHWIKPDVRRVGVERSMRGSVVDAIHERIAFCWSVMDQQLTPGKYLLGDTLSVLDLYVAVVSRFGPWRPRFYEVAPKMAPVIKAVDAHPDLVDLWAARFPER